ncbi:hypothetical protein HYE37_00880 [Mycoplasmopsis bovis]|nr:hypothetical protein [Mycoplasmopsis bovis]QQH21257.1 hypothetical protein HYE37_00880 [Mycoplasmopsis bovis]
MGKSTFTKKIVTNAVLAGNIAIVNLTYKLEYIKWANTLGGSNYWLMNWLRNNY